MERKVGTILVAGSANIDMVVRAPHIPAPGETVLGGDLLVNPGGKGANQAVACARAGGAPTQMLLALGDDVFAPMVEQSLLNAGVEPIIIRSDRPTGAALITVSDEAENAITVASGANADLTPWHLPSLESVDFLVMQLESPIASVTSYAKSAKIAGATVVLNAAPAIAFPDALIDATDILVVNEAELDAIVGAHGAIAEKLARTGVKTTIVTLGERGSCALTDGYFIVQPAYEVQPVDTTAAGDTFCGALVGQLAHGESMAEALRFATAAAALSTTVRGAQSSIPQRSDVLTMVAGHESCDHRFAALRRYCGLPDPN